MDFPRHAGVAERVSGDAITLLEQSAHGDQAVREPAINPGEMTQGTTWVDRPDARESDPKARERRPEERSRIRSSGGAKDVVP
jgi:hypothetical protein